MKAKTPAGTSVTKERRSFFQSRLVKLTCALTLLLILMIPTGLSYLASVRLLLNMKEESALASELGALVTDLRSKSGEPIRARSYGPPPEDAKMTVVLAHGIHHLGIEEPRLVRFANQLAEQGCHVLTPELEDLTEYEVTAQGAETLAASVNYCSNKSDDVGLVGFSFAGGQALIAAQEPQVAHNLKYVASIGGYMDLKRTLGFLSTGTVRSPQGTSERNAHEYGVLVLLKNHLSAFELGADEELFERVLRLWLHEEKAEAVELAKGLETQRAQELFVQVRKGKMTQHAGLFARVLDEQSQRLSDLSPGGHLDEIETKVILIHGADDPIVPKEETEWGEKELSESSEGPPHHVLVSPLLRHVGVEEEAGWREKIKLIRVMAQLF